MQCNWVLLLKLYLCKDIVLLLIKWSLGQTRSWNIRSKLSCTSTSRQPGGAAVSSRHLRPPNVDLSRWETPVFSFSLSQSRRHKRSLTVSCFRALPLNARLPLRPAGVEGGITAWACERRARRVHRRRLWGRAGHCSHRRWFESGMWELTTNESK